MILSPSRRLATLLGASGAVPSGAFLAALPGNTGPRQGSSRHLVTTPDTPVTCSFYLDNKLEQVWVDGVDVTDTVSGDPTSYNVEHVFTFDDTASLLAIKGRDYETGCDSGGLKISCTSSDNTSAWNMDSKNDRTKWLVSSSTGGYETPPSDDQERAWYEIGYSSLSSFSQPLSNVAVDTYYHTYMCGAALNDPYWHFLFSKPPPTESPTKSPTSSPTGSPTSTPTQTPTVPGPWIVSVDDVDANFSSGVSNEIEMDYYVGAGRQVQVELFATCDEGASVIEPDDLYSRTVSGPDPDASNGTHSKITVGYNFTKSEMLKSTLWDNSTNSLKFCQAVSLVTNDSSGGKLVIAQDRRNVEIQFDLSAAFAVVAALAAGIILNTTEEVDFEGQIKAFKCNGETFAENNEPLAPNTELEVCFESENESVDIADLEDMVINQDGSSVNVVVGGKIQVSAITSVTKVTQGIIAKTRVPMNQFVFARDKNITVSGVVGLELVGSGRRLRALVDEGDEAVAESEEAGYTVTVNLQGEEDSIDVGQAPIGSSDGHAAMGMRLGALASALAMAIVALVM